MLKFRLMGALALALFIGSSAVATGEDISDTTRKLIQKKMKHVTRLAGHSIIINAVTAHNAKKLRLERIQTIDTQWKAGGLENFVTGILNTLASQFLKKRVLSNKMLYTEIFVCGNQGAIVAMFPKTSDYWQGDEEKFSASFNKGKGRTFIGPLQYDESTQSISVQVSNPIKDGDQTIGVLVVGFRNIQ